MTTLVDSICQKIILNLSAKKITKQKLQLKRMINQRPNI